MSAAPILRFPRYGTHHFGSLPQRILLLCFYDPAGISTVPETVAYMQAFSQFRITVLNLFEHRRDMASMLVLGTKVNLAHYDALIIHNSLSYNVDNLRVLDSDLPISFKDFSGIKVLMKQDENYRMREMAEYIGATGFQLILTCLDDADIPKVYPPELCGTPEFERMLTGYVTPYLRSLEHGPEHRDIDVGYRGSIQPLSFGRLAYEKRQIGDAFTQWAAPHSLSLDISSRWEDRINGVEWFRFLRRCKATLGAESGASLFDLNGGLEKRCAAIISELGPEQADAAYAEAYLERLSDLEGNAHYNQISPRHFEAAALGTLQILYPGTYSGIFKEHEHYIPLARDGSNTDEVIGVLKNDSHRTKIVAQAHEDIIQNQAYWIETFMRRLDTLLLKRIMPPSVQTVPGQANILLLASHTLHIDPRLHWISDGTPPNLIIHQIGVAPSAPASEQHEKSHDYQKHTAPKVSWWNAGSHMIAELLRAPETQSLAAELIRLERLSDLPQHAFSEATGIAIHGERLDSFRWSLKHFLTTAVSLLQYAWDSSGISAIIATDLDTLLPALILGNRFCVPVIYDAHEYWPEADPMAAEGEIQFWEDLEKRLVSEVALAVTVSSPLAQLMAKRYGPDFITLPNCEPLRQFDLPEKPKSETCIFLFQGGFAPARGIDLLIKAWHRTDKRAILWLRGPHGKYRDEMIALARAQKLFNKRIFFPEPVKETELVTTAALADVGLIPYTPHGVNYSNCCPNKMSQYMAAQLPILANNTHYVRQIISQANAGIVIDFSVQDQLVHAVNKLCANPTLREQMAKSGHEYYCTQFNWNTQSVGFYARLAQLIPTGGTKHLFSVAGLNRNEVSNPATSFVFTNTTIWLRSLCDQALGLSSQTVLYKFLRFGYAHLPSGLRKILSRRILKMAYRD